MASRMDIATEKAALHKRCVALMNYILTPEFAKLSPKKQDVLKRQIDAMDKLEKVLGERLSVC